MRAASIVVVALLVGSAAADPPKEKPKDETTVEIVKPPPPKPPVHPDKPQPAGPPDPFLEFSGANGAARDLYNEGRKLLSEGNPTQGCTKLTASWQQEEATSTEMALGACREGESKFAEARRLYEDAARRSRLSGFEERAKFATDKAATLDDKLSILVIRLKQPIAKGTVVTVNDQVIETAPEVRTGVDAGDVTVTAKGPTGVTSTKKFRVFLHTTTNVEVPTLEEREGGRKPVWIAASVVLGLGGLIALGAGSGVVQFVGGGAIAVGIGVFLLAPRDKVTVVPMTTSNGGAGVALIGHF